MQVDNICGFPLGPLLERFTRKLLLETMGWGTEQNELKVLAML